MIARGPSIRLPLWAAVAIAAAAYTLRAIGRGGDFSPDLPGDVLAAALLAGGILIVGAVRWSGRSDGSGDGLSDQVQHEDGSTRDAGQDQDVLGKVE